MTLNSVLLDTGKIIGKFIFDILFFPFWWYSRGFFKVLLWAKTFLFTRLQGTALLVWVKNIFTPMYGQHDWAGILISFLTRLMQIIYRSIVMLFWLLITLMVICLWLAVPVYILFQLVFQFNVTSAL
jgi:hypothetical protein